MKIRKPIDIIIDHIFLDDIVLFYKDIIHYIHIILIFLAKYSEDAKDLKDKYMHLTNYSINKFSTQYTANEDANACQGHKW